MQEGHRDILFPKLVRMSLAAGRGRELESRFQFGENNGDEGKDNSKRT
jgi:hypothetical protein